MQLAHGGDEAQAEFVLKKERLRSSLKKRRGERLARPYYMI